MPRGHKRPKHAGTSDTMMMMMKINTMIRRGKNNFSFHSKHAKRIGTLFFRPPPKQTIFSLKELRKIPPYPPTIQQGKVQLGTLIFVTVRWHQFSDSAGCSRKRRRTIQFYEAFVSCFFFPLRSLSANCDLFSKKTVLLSNFQA